jgi:hypothetical protein
MTARFSKLRDPKSCIFQRQRANGDWAKPISFYLSDPSELLKFGVPANRANSIFRQLIQLLLGSSLTVEL